MNFLDNYTPNITQKNIAVKLNAKGEKIVLQGHPWVFSNNIIKVSKPANTGDLAIIFSKQKNKIIGIGLFDMDSPIQIKIIDSSQKKVNIDAAYFTNKIATAFKKREKLLQTNTNSYRLIFGENDGFPSLIADVYNTVLVVKLYSNLWTPYLKFILMALLNISNSKTLVLRLSRSMQANSQCNFNDGDVVYGTLTNEIVKFIEHGVNFSANVIKGHKTGYFLDHRYNRKHVGILSKHKTVLDVFSYAGGFSVHALANGATSVTSLDISKQALEVAKQNGLLNNYKGVHNTIVGDAFKVMKTLIDDNKNFDIVVIDPPSFAKKQTDIELAKKKYAELAILGAKLTAKNGILVLASCSSRVTAQAFFDLNSTTLSRKNRAFKLIKKTQHDIDHPVGFNEGAYLKCGYYQFLD